MKTKLKLRIADAVIEMQSDFGLKELSEEEKRGQRAERFANFFFEGPQKADIRIKVEIVDQLPDIRTTQPVFVTYHFQEGNENWRLHKKNDLYVFRSSLGNRKQLIVINKTFDTAIAYVLPNAMSGRVWEATDIIYDFLQILLIHYFALRNDGIFVHGVGMKDIDGRGLLFAGKSGAGKSTTARIWHTSSKAMVLNDDRIIVRKRKGVFFIFGSPWHGDFSDYLLTRIEGAPLRRCFFIYHSPRNRLRKVAGMEAFSRFYPSLFPAFWDKTCLEHTSSFAMDLIARVPCFMLGFKNDTGVIDFVRKA
jgi:hypothetical protein